VAAVALPVQLKPSGSRTANVIERCIILFLASCAAPGDPVKNDTTSRSSGGLRLSSVLQLNANPLFSLECGVPTEARHSGGIGCGTSRPARCNHRPMSRLMSLNDVRHIQPEVWNGSFAWFV
jgi:hypothetical protein